MNYLIFVLCLNFIFIVMAKRGTLEEETDDSEVCKRFGNKCQFGVTYLGGSNCCRGLVCQRGLNPKPIYNPDEDFQDDDDDDQDGCNVCSCIPEPPEPQQSVCAKKGKPCGDKKGLKCCVGLRCELNDDKAKGSEWGFPSPSKGICVGTAIYG